MNSWNSIKSIFKKEISGYFNNPTSYIVVITFLLLWEFFFFKSVFVIGQASLANLFGLIPWLFLILVPALTMGAISEEKSNETLEFLLTHPLKDRDLILGKYFASLTFIAGILLFSLPIGFSLSAFGDMDWGVVFSQYLASFLFAGTLVALGILVSTLLKSQISSLMITVVSGFLLIIAGTELVTEALPASVGGFIANLSVMTHYFSMSRGVIDMRDIWYFISLPTVLISFSYLWLLLRRYSKTHPVYKAQKRIVFAILIVALLGNVFNDAIPGRIDLTEGNVYTLSQATKDILAGLDNDITVVLYQSGNLPVQLDPVIRETKDTLKDYGIYAGGKFILEVKDPQKDSAIEMEAQSSGVYTLPIQVSDDNGVSMLQAQFGLVVKYFDEERVIPAILNTFDLEYQLTSFISELTNSDRKVIGFLSGHEELGMHTNFSAFAQELDGLFDLAEVILDEENSEIPAGIDALIIAGPRLAYEETALLAIETYLDNGGSAMILVDTLEVDAQSMTASPIETNLPEFLLKYGVNVNRDLVYDLRSNETITVSSGMFSYMLPYPLWPRTIAREGVSLVSRLNNLITPWASSLSFNKDVLEEKGIKGEILFTTTQYASTQTDNFIISPDGPFTQANMSIKRMALSLLGTEVEGASTSTPSALRMVIVGDTDFLGEYGVGAPENIAFGMEAVSWLTQEESLAGIRIKQQSSRDLLFETTSQVTLVKWSNLLVALLLPLAIAAIRFSKRKSLKERIVKS